MAYVMIVINKVQIIFGKLRKKGFNDEQHFPKRIKFITSQVKMNTFLKADYKSNIRRCEISIHQAMIISVGVRLKK